MTITSCKSYLFTSPNYKEALRIERRPELLIALGQVYMRRASARMKAHEVFREATSLLATRLDLTVTIGEARIGLRGFASLQALATADVMAGINPEFWRDHLENLVGAAISSFVGCARRQESEYDHAVRTKIARPAILSAAINYYLAANSASRYLLDEKRDERVSKNLKRALRCLGLVSQFDRLDVEHEIESVRELWALTLLPLTEADLILSAS